MKYNQDTDWELSAKGNFWRRIDGVLLVVGKDKYDRVWARVAEDFLEGPYDSLCEAKTACEEEVK